MGVFIGKIGSVLIRSERKFSVFLRYTVSLFAAKVFKGNASLKLMQEMVNVKVFLLL